MSAEAISGKLSIPPVIVVEGLPDGDPPMLIVHSDGTIGDPTPEKEMETK